MGVSEDFDPLYKVDKKEYSIPSRYLFFGIIYKKFNMKGKFRMRKTRDEVVAHDQNVSFVEE